MHTHSLAAYVQGLNAGAVEEIGELMLSSAHKLSAAGANFLICPDNSIHQAFSYVIERSPLPWLHIADVVADAASTRGFSRLGLTGTRWLVESEVYPEKLTAKGLTYVRPDNTEAELMNRIIMEELVRGIFSPEAVVSMRSIVQRMAMQGCDAVVLGCTELPLILNDSNLPLPTLDSTRLLARAALQAAIA
jgi:aspartate racemase